MLSDTANKHSECWNVANLVAAAKEFVTDHLLFIHAWSGCDTTSAIFGQGKLTYM